MKSKKPPRHDIKFTWWSHEDKEKKVLDCEMMTVPREGEAIDALLDFDGNVIGDFVVEKVSYQRVGKYEDGSHGIVVQLHQRRKGSSRLERDSTVGFV